MRSGDRLTRALKLLTASGGTWTFARTVTDERERAILEKRLLPPEGVAPLTLQDIGREFGLTRERARQIEAKLTARLRDYVRAEIPDFQLLVADE